MRIYSCTHCIPLSSSRSPRSLSRMVSLKAEVETLEEELNQMRSSPLYYPNKMQEQKKKLLGLREELHSMEQKFDALDNTFREERKREEDRLSAELTRIKAAEEEKRIQKSQTKAEKQRHENEIDEEYRVSAIFFSSNSYLKMFFSIG